MKAHSLAFHVVAVMLIATPAAAGELHYWGAHHDAETIGVIELDRQLLTVRAGDVVPGWGRVHAVDASEIVIERRLSDEQKGALAARGQAVYDGEHLHVRNVQLMLPQPATAPR